MTTSGNVARVQEMYAAFGQGKIQTILDGVTPDVTWIVQGPTGLPFFGTRRGPAQVAQFFQEVAQHLDIQEFSPREFISQGEQVVAVGNERGRVRATGRDYQSAWVHVFNFQNGKVIQFREFSDTAALADAFRPAASVKHSAA
jgi:ketosteroid isomerase-like protein